MRLTRLAAENWMGYETLDLDFGAVSRVAVTGRNNHGKSALLDALEWALWGKVGRDIDQRSSDKFIRRGTDLVWVTVEFTAMGHDVVVRREKPAGRTSTLLLTVDGVEQRGHVIGRKGDELLTLDETQARIDALVGLGYDAITAGPFMAQEQASYFMKALPRDRKDLLIRLLGVDAYEPLAKAAATAVTKYEAIATHEARSVERLSAVVATGEDLEVRMAEAQVALNAASVDEVNAIAAFTRARDAYVEAKAQSEHRQAATDRVSRAQSALERAIGHHVLAEAERESARLETAVAPPVITLPDRPSPAVIEEAAAKLAAVTQQVADVSRVTELAEGLRQELARAERQRAIAETVPCGAAGPYAACRFLTDVPSEQDFIAAQVSLRNAEQDVADMPAVSLDEAQLGYRRALEHSNEVDRQYREADRQRELWQTKHDYWQAELTRAEAAIETAEAERVVAEAERAEAESALAALGAATVDLSALATAGAEAQRVAKEARAAREAAQAALKPLEAEMAIVGRARDDLADAQTAMAEAEAKAATHRLLAAAWHRDGIPTSLIEAAVPRIEAKANAVLERMPEDLAVRLRTQRPTKTGMAETLDAVVAVDGWESDYALLSVGARFRVDLALRLALADLLTSRTGATIETLWLDEPLAALDAEGREAAVETLGALDDFGLIVVVSHHDDMNDRFPARIRVSKEDGVSTAVMES